MRGVFNLGKYLKFRHLKWLILGLVVIGIAVWNLYGVREGLDNDTTTGRSPVKTDFPVCGIVFGDNNPENRYHYFMNTLKNDDARKLLTKPPAKTVKLEKYDLDYYVDFPNKGPPMIKSDLEKLTLDEWNKLDGEEKSKNDTKKTLTDYLSENIEQISPTDYLIRQLEDACQKYRQNNLSNMSDEEKAKLVFDSSPPDGEDGNSNSTDNDGGASANMSDAEKTAIVNQYKQWEKEQNGEQDTNGKDKSNANPGEEGGEEGGEEAMTTMRQPWQFR